MAKKSSKPDFSAAAAASKDILAAIAQGGPQGVQEAQDTPNTLNAPHVQGVEDGKRDKAAQCTRIRFTYKMPVEYKAYLERAVYRESSPQHIWTITEYLNHLIAMDMVRNGEEPPKNEDCK